jgi:acid stress chaperone HdeA
MNRKIVLLTMFLMFAVMMMVVGSAYADVKPAGKKPLTKMTCEDFLAIESTFQPKAVYFAAAYAKGGKPESAVLDVEGMETVVPAVVDECQKAPKASFWEKVKEKIKKLEKKL